MYKLEFKLRILRCMEIFIFCVLKNCTLPPWGSKSLVLCVTQVTWKLIPIINFRSKNNRKRIKHFRLNFLQLALNHNIRSHVILTWQIICG